MEPADAQAEGPPGRTSSGFVAERVGRRSRSIGSDTLSRRLSRELIADIVRGDSKPGQELPSEDQLAEDFGVSRPVVREAVKHLAVLGLVQSRQGRQTRVAPYEAWNHFAPQILAVRREVAPSRTCCWSSSSFAG